MFPYIGSHVCICTLVHCFHVLLMVDPLRVDAVIRRTHLSDIPTHRCPSLTQNIFLPTLNVAPSLLPPMMTSSRRFLKTSVSSIKVPILTRVKLRSSYIRSWYFSPICVPRPGTRNYKEVTLQSPVQVYKSSSLSTVVDTKTFRETVWNVSMSGSESLGGFHLRLLFSII